MAATITGVFTLVDRATGPMQRMERQAKKTMAAIEAVGVANDKAAGGGGGGGGRAARNWQNQERAMRNTERQARTTQRTLGGLGNEMKNVEARGNRAGSMLDKLGMKLRNVGAILTAVKFGVLAVGITALAQAIGVLAGGAVALVPALASAGGAIAALPATVGAAIQGLLGFKVAVGGVGEALKAGMALQKNAGRSAQQYADMQTSAADSIRNAERQLYLAQRNSKDAQVALTEARRAARRELTDMAMAARGASLAEQRAGIGVKQARQQLAQTLTAPGSTSLDIQSARLGVQESLFSQRQARIDRGRATADNRRTQQRGVGRNQGVINAQRNVADATYAQTEATRALARAQRDATRQLAQGTSEMDGYAQAMKELSPSAQHFVKQVVDMRPAFMRLRSAGAEALFPHLSASLERVTRLMPLANRLMRNTGGTLGRGIEGIADRMTTPGRAKDLGVIGDQQNRILSRMMRGFGNLSEALVDFMVAAQPFTDWLTSTIEGWTKYVEISARVGRETGSTAASLEKTRTNLQRFGRILSNVWGIMRGVLRAATPLGDRLWDGAEKATKGWDDYVNSVGGSKKIEDWFNRLYDPLHALGKLSKDLLAAWGRLTIRPEFTRSIEALDRAVPGIERFMTSMSGMGPAVAGVVEQLATLLGNLPVSPLQIMLETLDKILRLVNLLVENVPGLGTVLSGILVLGALRTSIGLVGRLGGKWKDLFSMWRTAPEPPIAPGGGGVGPVVTGRAGRGRGGRKPRPGGGMPAPPASPGTGARPGRLARFGGPAALLGGTAALVAGEAIGGSAGGALSGAATGAMMGATVGSFIPGVGTVVGGAAGGVAGGVLGYLGGRGDEKRERRSAAQGAAAGYVGRGATVAERRLADLRARLGRRTTVAGLYGTGHQDYAVTGGKRERLQAEADALKKALPGARTERAMTTLGQMQQISSIMQTGNASQRRQGRGQIAKMYGEEFKRAGPEGRRALANATAQWAQQLSKGDRSQRRMARGMTKAIKDNWQDMGKEVAVVNGQVYGGTDREWKKIGTALKDPVEQARQKVSKGFTDMQKAAIGSLTAMGYSRAEAKRMIRNADATTTDPTATRPDAATTAHRNTTGAAGPGHRLNARGGRIPGHGLQDTVPVAPGNLAAPGELIVNRHTEHRVNRLLGGATTLGREVAGENTPHSAALDRALHGRYVRAHAQGGRIVDIPGNPGEKIDSGVLPALMQIINRYHVKVTDGLGTSPPHARNSDHLWGGAVDLVPGGGAYGSAAGNWGNIDALAAWAEPTQNNPRYPFRWVGYTGDPGHGRGNHLHLSWQRSAVGKTIEGLGAPGAIPTAPGAAGAAKIPAALTGLTGMPGAIGDAALRGVAAGLNQRLAGAGGGGGGDLSNFSGGGTAEANQRLGRRMMLAMGWGEGEWPALKSLWTGESGWNHLIANKSSGAYGIPQSLPGSKMASEGADWRTNPATQIAWGLKYIKGRYKSPSGALAAWNSRSPHWYEMGGRVPDWGGWNAQGGSFKVNRPTLFGAGEGHGSETVHISRNGGGPGAAGGITVTIANINHNREGDVAEHIRREFELLAEDIGLVSAGGDD